METIDVLLIAALKEEYEAARDVAQAQLGVGVPKWEDRDTDTATPYLLGQYQLANGHSLSIALARPTRMGSTATAPLAASLVERLKPQCLAMCGVCAGNPADVALGDVIIAEMTYVYDEGKRKKRDFEPDQRQMPMRDTWVRSAQDLKSEGLPSFGEASDEEAKLWILERLCAGDDPRKHPARSRYFPGDTWATRIQALEDSGLVKLNGLYLMLTDYGRASFEKALFYNDHTPTKLPFEIKVGPIASGNVVVKDGVTWDKLKRWGVRSVLGLEMEAAAISTIAHRLEVPHWVVVKAVMDHADPRKDDRYKPFAARASAEVLFKFLDKQFTTSGANPPSRGSTLAKSVYVIGGVSGETEYPDFEKTQVDNMCVRLGEIIAKAGAELIVCSPFPDSADVYSVVGYVGSGIEGKIHFHSPRHPNVATRRIELQRMLGESSAKILDWYYPGPEDEDSWQQAWLLCQLQALEHADVVIAIGGRYSNSANTLLHLAEARGIPVVPFAFLGGASRRAFERRDWGNLHPGLDHNLLLNKQGIESAMMIANRLMTDRIKRMDRRNPTPKTFFISRASIDSSYGDALTTFLKGIGLTPLLGETEIQDERMVLPTIEEAILKSDVSIILWSRSYATSRWCNDELEFSVERANVGEISVWLFNIDGSDVVPRRARDLPQVVTRTPQALIEAVRTLLHADRYES